VISFYLCIEQKKKKKKKVFAILIYEMVCVNCKERLRESDFLTIKRKNDSFFSLFGVRESGDRGKIGIGKQRW